MQHRTLVYLLVVMDWLFATLSWMLFYFFRKVGVEKVQFNVNESFYAGVVIVPLLWVLLFFLQGTYHDVKRLYRIKVFNLTFLASLIGSLIIFFTLLLDDEINGYQQYYRSVILLFVTYFTLTFVPRLIFVSIVVARIHSGKYAFPTLLIGGSDKAVEIFNEIISLPKGIHRFIGFVNINGVDRQLEEKLNYLGHVNDLDAVLRENNVEEVTIRTSKGGRPVVHLTREMNFDDMDREIRKLTKKGTFRDIIIKSRDGRLKYFERTEVIKL